VKHTSVSNLAVALCIFAVLICTEVSAQDASRTSAPTSTHGLRLTLSPGTTKVAPEEAAQWESCETRNAPLACVPLELTLENHGTETVVWWYASCDGLNFSVQIKNRDGVWQPFPRSRDLYACARNVAVIGSIAPGGRLEFQLRLADAGLRLDTTSPNVPRNVLNMSDGKGYALLTGEGPHPIRMSLSLTGCVADKRVPPESVRHLNPFDNAVCVGGKAPEDKFILLDSNELALKPSDAGK